MQGKPYLKSPDTVKDRRTVRRIARRLGVGGMRGKNGVAIPFHAWRGQLIMQKEMYKEIRNG